MDHQDSQWGLLAQWIEESSRIVFFGGAGVSTESGIPDFRGAKGFYHQDREIPLEQVLSIDFFTVHPQAYWEWFAQEIAREGVAPEDGQTEFLVLVGRGDVLVRVGFHPGGDPHQRMGLPPEFPAGGLDAVYFVEGVDDDAPNPLLQGETDLLRRLVVAVEPEPLRRHPPGQGDPHLPHGRHVHVEPVLGHPARHRPGKQGLSRVVDTHLRAMPGESILECLAVPACPSPECVFRKYVLRSIKLFDKLTRCNAVNS